MENWSLSMEKKETLSLKNGHSKIFHAKNNRIALASNVQRKIGNCVLFGRSMTATTKKTANKQHGEKNSLNDSSIKIKTQTKIIDL